MFGRRRFPTFVVALTASALLVGVSAAEAANGGNSAAAKPCQKGGWQDLATSTGESFATAGECVSYAAQGGTFRTRPASFADACAANGGLFIDIDGDVWSCIAPTSEPFVDTAEQQLAERCAAAGGSFTEDPSGGGEPWVYDCTFV